MLSCIYAGKEFNNKQEEYTEKQIRDLGLERQLSCPKCGGAVFFCAEGKVTSHFKHFENPCEDKHIYKYDINTERHHKSVELFYYWLCKQYPDVQIVKDKYLTWDDMEQKADLYLEVNEVKVAIEIQFKHINFDDMEEKRCFYSKMGIKDIWIFVKNDTFKPGTPYERHYYRSNNRELYFYCESSRKFIYFKGLKKELFMEGNMKFYITHECNIDEVKLAPSGDLLLPSCRKKYLEKLNALRKSNYSAFKVGRMKMQVLQKRQRMKQEAGKDIDTASYPPWIKDAMKAVEVSTTRVVSDSSTYIFDFKEIKFFQHNGKSHAEIIYIHNGETKVIYEIRSRSGSANEIFLICKKPGIEDYIYDLQITNLPNYKKVRVVKHSVGKGKK